MIEAEVENNMNRSKKILLIVLCFLAAYFLCFALAWLAQFLIFSHADLWRLNADFENYKSDFCAVKDYAAERFPSENERIIAVSKTKDKGVSLFDYAAKEGVDVPEEIKPALEEIVRHGFPNKDAVFSAFQVCGSRVAFLIESRQYALIYSPNEKPTWLNSPDEQIKIKVRSAGDGWYHVVKKPGWK